MERVHGRGRYLFGPEVEAFELEFAEFLGAAYCLGVASGTDALTLALRAVGVGAGDEVITVAHTAVATVAAIEAAGATVVLADIDRRSRCIDPNSVRTLLSERTRALVPVHLYGQPADLAALQEIAASHGLAVVEDCAQAVGARYEGSSVGTLGTAAAFSFYPTKNLAALGDGGAVTTSDPEIARRVRRLACYGWDEGRESMIPGVNSRLDELQAAVLRVRLPHLPRQVERRREIARRYREVLEGSQILPPPEIPGSDPAYHLYVVETEDREALAQGLRRRHIDTAIHYAKPIHRQTAYRGRLRGAEHLSQTEALASRILTLPLFPQLTTTELNRVGEALHEFCR